nr:hypothetical protein [Tanacetum cinerariifolium]
MNTTQAQQKALDDALVALADRLEFEKFNMRLKTDIKPKEATFQVMLDALALTPFYRAFLITAIVHAIYMQEFWATVLVHKSSISFTINKKKVSLDVDMFREILQICLKNPRQEFKDLPLEQDIISFISDLGHSQDITYLTDVNVDYLHQPWRAFSTVINKCLSGKETGMDKSISRRNKMLWHTPQNDTVYTSMRCISRHEKTQKPVQASKGTKLKKKAKVAKSDKKKQPAKKPKAKGLVLLSKVALTEAEQLKLVTKRSKKDFHISHASGSGDGVNTQSKDNDMDEFEDDADNDDDSSKDHDDESDDEKTKSDRDGIPGPNLTNVDQTEHKEEDIDERVHTPSDYELSDDEKIHDEENVDEEEEDKVTKELYDDVNVNLGNKDTEMTNANQGASEQQNASHQSGFEQEEEDVHVTLTPVLDTQKTRGPTQSSSIYSDFTSKLLNLDNPSPANNEITSLMDTTAYQATAIPEITSSFTTPTPSPPPFFNSSIATSNTNSDTNGFREYNITSCTSRLRSLYEAAATLFEFELTKILVDKMEKNKSIDRSRDERDNDRDPSAGSDRGTKRRKSSKDDVASKDSRSKEKKSSSTSKNASQSRHKPFGKSAHAEETSHTVEDSGMQHDQEFVTRDNDEQPANKEVTKADWFKKPKRPPTHDHDWSKRRQVDRRPPQTWISQVAHAEEPRTSFDELNDTSFDFSAFVINRLKIPNLTQEILVRLAFNLLKGTCKSLTELEYHLEEYSKATTERLDWHNPENKLRIIAVTRLKIMKKYDYGHLEDIEVHRDDQQLYMFKEGDFKRLCLQDIEDMLLLLIQQNLTNLTIDERYDLNLALRMYTRRIVIQKRVEDLQLGVESYQKKLNLTKSGTYKSNLRNKTAYTSYSGPHEIINVDQFKRKRLIRTDELRKFSDGMLNDVWIALHDIVAGIKMKYLPMRKWGNLDKKRASVMVQEIDKQLYQRRLMRNLEKFVGGRVYGNDLRLLERTI